MLEKEEIVGKEFKKFGLSKDLLHSHGFPI